MPTQDDTVMPIIHSQHAAHDGGEGHSVKEAAFLGAAGLGWLALEIGEFAFIDSLFGSRSAERQTHARKSLAPLIAIGTAVAAGVYYAIHIMHKKSDMVEHTVTPVTALPEDTHGPHQPAGHHWRHMVAAEKEATLTQQVR